MNKLVNPVFKACSRPQFLFSTKKKSIELTLRTPYRTRTLTQAPFSKISQVSAESSQRTWERWWSSRTARPPPCMSSPQAPSNSNWTARWRESRTNTSTPEAGPPSTRSHRNSQGQLSRDQPDGRSRKERREGRPNRQSRTQIIRLSLGQVHLQGQEGRQQIHRQKSCVIWFLLTPYLSYALKLNL